MDSYLVSKLDETTVGGLGHLFDDIVTSYIITEIFDLEHLHFPFQNCPSHLFTDWEQFFNFGRNEINYHNFNKEDYEIIKVKTNRGNFKSFTFEELEKIFLPKKNNVIYEIIENSRVWINELYVWEQEGKVKEGTYWKIINKLRAKIKSLYKKSTSIECAIHIRIGAGTWCALDDQIQYIKFILNKLPSDYNFTLYGKGSMQNEKYIMEQLKTYNINFDFHSRDDLAFIKMINSDLLIAGRSRFTRVIGLFHEGIKIYQRGELRPPWWKETLKGDMSKKYNVGNHIEIRDKKEWLHIDDEFNYDEDHLKIMLNSLKKDYETITILMPAYNEEKNIKNSIQSILNQTHQNFKIIVLDDNSNDNTINVIKSLEDPRITIYKNKVNKGRGYNRNKLMDLSTTKLSCWLDADDKMLPEKLEKQLLYFKENPKCTFLATRMFDVTKNGEIIGEGSNKKQMVDSLTEKTIMLHNPINNPTVMFLTDVGRKLRYKEEMKAEEDWDFWKRLYLSGNKVSCLEDLLLLYTINNHTI